MTITAIPSSGYEFDHWEGSLTGSANPAAILVSSARTVTAVFVTRFLVSIGTTPGESGDVTPTPAQPDTGYRAGTAVSLAAVANAGYVFDHWEGDLDGSANPAELLVSDNEEVTAVFLPVFRVTVDATPEGSGTVTLDPPQPADGYAETSSFRWWWIAIGTSVVALAAAAGGMVYRGWKQRRAS